MSEIKLTSSIQLLVNGEAMQQISGSNLIEVLVDQHAHLPGMFALRLFDSRLELLDKGLLNMGDEVEILSAESKGNTVSLMRGTIVSIDPVFGRNGTAEIRVRGYDKAYQLYRNVHSRTFLNVKDSDLATTIAEEWGLDAEVDTTSTVYGHVYQHNQSDLAFLFQRAWRIGYECFVSEDTLYFREPKPLGQPNVTLRWRENLLSFRPRMSLAEQVNEVIVRGWDAEQQVPVVGRARTGKLFAQIKDAPADLISREAFGTGKLTIVDQPVTTQAEADILANARMDEISGAFVTAEGVAFRQPGLRAGEEVKLEGLGQRFSGTFLITSAKHTFSAGGGLETKFEVSGTRRGLITEQMHSRKGDRWFGIYTAVVTNNNDPLNMGRVKVRFPWLDENGETDWLRLVSFGATSDSGFFIPPSVNDQVLVGFEHGEFNRPIILGTLPRPMTEDLIGPTTPTMPTNTGDGVLGMPSLSSLAISTNSGVSENGRSTISRWRSPDGNAITMHHSLINNCIVISTSSGHTIKVDETNGSITLATALGQTIHFDDLTQTININSTGDINLNSQGNLSLSAIGSIELFGTGLNVNGVPIAGA